MLHTSTVIFIFVGIILLGVMMFGSNVQPKRIIREQRKEPWWCHTCDRENKAFYSKCPSCGGHRPH